VLIIACRGQFGGVSGNSAQQGTSEYNQNRNEISQHANSGFGSGIENSIESAVGMGGRSGGGSSGGMGGSGGFGGGAEGTLQDSMTDRMVDSQIVSCPAYHYLCAAMLINAQNKYIPDNIEQGVDKQINKYI
jgi:hypothetical protein